MNRAVLFGKIRWGKINFYEVYEDTERVAALDAHLAGRQFRRDGLKEAPGYKRAARLLRLDACGMNVLCGGVEEPNHDPANPD